MNGASPPDSHRRELVRERRAAVAHAGAKSSEKYAACGPYMALCPNTTPSRMARPITTAIASPAARKTEKRRAARRSRRTDTPAVARRDRRARRRRNRHQAASAAIDQPHSNIAAAERPTRSSRSSGRRRCRCRRGRSPPAACPWRAALGRGSRAPRRSAAVTRCAALLQAGERRRLHDLQPDEHADANEQQAEEKRDPPAPRHELRVARRRR